MKNKAITILLALTSVSLAQNPIFEQKRLFEGKRKAALVEIEKEHVSALMKLREKFQEKGDDYMAEMAFKEATDFLEDKFARELNGTVWNTKGETGSRIVFGAEREVECFNPESWFRGVYTITGLNTLEFRTADSVWTMKCDFAKGSAVIESRALQGPPRPKNYPLIKK